MCTEATGYSCLMWFNKNRPSNHFTLPSFQFPLPLPPPSLSLLSSPSPLPPSVHPNGETYPPQTHSNTCTRIQNFTVVRKRLHVHVWQSWVEIKHYSVAYFDHIIKHCNRNFIEGGAHTHYVDLSSVHVSTLCISPTLTRSSALQHFKHNNTIEMCNRNDRFLPRTARCNKQ